MAEQLRRFEALKKNDEKWLKKAEENNRYVELNYADEIDASVKNAVVYGGPDREPKELSAGSKPEISIVNKCSEDAVFEYVLPDKKTAVLNFADYKVPGGMYMKGKHAQEESLCHSSNLYGVLSRLSEYYDWNKIRKNSNKNLYLDRAIYIPDVVLFHDEQVKACDVITCASPNWKKASKLKCPPTKEENSIALKERIRFIHKIAAEQKVDILILGAFGCGAFKQESYEVARLFKEEFKKTTIKRIIYAIKANRSKKNFEVFKSVFGEQG